jgi:hypothetical protein
VIRSASRGAGARRCALLLILVAGPCIACGVKGPPQPPLVRVPVAPGDLTAQRRGDRVDLRFVVPAENADGSRPANIGRVDVYALTGPASVSDQVLLKRGTRVASVQVKTPRDPDETVPPGDPISDVEPPQGPGLDQGAAATVQEVLTADALEAVDLRDPDSIADKAVGIPLVGPAAPPSRIFVAVSISARGRQGSLSRRAVVSMAPAPAPVARPEVVYDETTVKVTWPTSRGAGAAREEGVLPSRRLGVATPSLAYHVYEVAAPARVVSATTSGPYPPEAVVEKRLTGNPVADGEFVDKRITWGVERCYTVRVVQTLSGAPIESDSAPLKCVTLVDTFPPASPAGLTPIPSEGAITLIWNPNAEADLAGYLVFRASPSEDAPAALTPAPIQLATFRDTVPSGARFAYVVRAIDKAGNTSAESARVEETAR